MLIGSEGVLGAIAEAWVRVRPRPEFKLSRGVEFDDFVAGARAVREIAQSGLQPSNCRLLDASEAELTGAGDGSSNLLILGFESADHPVDHWMDVATQIAQEHGGLVRASDEVASRTAQGGQGGGASADDSGREAEQSSSVSAWRGAFLLAPYLRDTFVACGVLSETFETAITWDHFEEFHASVMDAAAAVTAEASGSPTEDPGSPRVSCRFTHVYPDGVAPYFTVLAPAIRGSEVEQWYEIKAAVSEALIDGGGTITHHHAVGRDHRPWYDRQRPAPFAAALRAVKAELDPAGMLNPGVLVDPR
jgi:alkyldihydroxyacetonephosphate synthase